DKEPRLPENTIDCKQFKKTGAQEWQEVGTAVFNLGSIRDINLTAQPVTPHYFKFDGFDLYTVVEQKCGAIPQLSNMTAQEPAAAQIAAPKPELAQEKSAPASIPTSAQAAAAKPELEQEKIAPASVPALAQAKTQAVPVAEKKIVESPSGSASCGDKNSVYIADSLNTGLIEIVFKGTSASHTDFIIRESRNNKVEWAYKGKKIQEQFMFTPLHSKQEKTSAPLTFTPVHFSREKPVMLTLDYVKPNRNGTGEAILYLSGLRSLFASGQSHRFKFEGNRPGEFLPEAFYFDRCE
ncbi:MAG: hypothetical protein ACLP02_10260, partial [Rhodomicrobium sp.]